MFDNYSVRIFPFDRIFDNICLQSSNVVDCGDVPCQIVKLDSVKVHKGETTDSGLRQLHRNMAAETSQSNNQPPFFIQYVNLKDPFVS